MTTDIIVMILLVIGIIILFLLEPISVDFIALSVPIILDNWIKVTSEEALAGFYNTATITILTMFILSSAVQKYGFIQILGEKTQDISQDNNLLRCFIIITTVALISGLLNNTNVLAIFIPLVINLSRKTETSPSKI